ncbi:MAG: hypothetical protein M3305_02120 [Actinomycetota bacterium]|nr:hypothetical protein [Actinomycetota bacterium]
MRLLSTRQLSILLVGTLLLCHGVFGASHLLCDLSECAGGAEHAAEHQPAAGSSGDAHERLAGHGWGAQYFAVIVGLLGVLLSLLPKRSSLWIKVGERWPAVLRRVPAMFHPPPTPTTRLLQVFRL